MVGQSERLPMMMATGGAEPEFGMEWSFAGGPAREKARSIGAATLAARLASRRSAGPRLGGSGGGVAALERLGQALVHRRRVAAAHAGARGRAGELVGLARRPAEEDEQGAI